MNKRILAWLGTVGLAFLTGTTGAESDLSGTYILVQETTSVTRMPVLSDVVAKTTAVSIQHLHHKGDRLRGQGKLCSVKMTSNSKLVKTTLPPAFQTALPPVTTDAKLERQGSSLAFSQPTQTLVIGAKLKNKNDALPSSAKDPRVTDDDGDGKPGVTVRVSGVVSGEIYLVQRSTSRLSGHATPDGFHGKIQFTNDQKILDATSRVLRRDPRAKPDPSRSWFRLHRVEGSVDCGEATRIASSW